MVKPNWPQSRTPKEIAPPFSLELMPLEGLHPSCGPGEKRSLCTCTESEKRKFKGRLGGAILDRIDLKIKLAPLSVNERFAPAGGESSKTIRGRVEAARELQKKRFAGTEIRTNARIPGGFVDKFCELHSSAEAALREVAKRIPELGMRGHDKLLKTSRTIADLNNSPVIYKKHVVEAADLCGHESVRDFLLSMADQDICPVCQTPVDARFQFCPKCGRVLRN